MNEEIEYAEMLEIPLSTVNVVRKKRRKKATERNEPLKDSVIASVNDRVETPPELAEAQPLPEGEDRGNALAFDPVPERIDTVRLYSTNEESEELRGYDYALNEGGRVASKSLSKKMRLALGIEFGVACALCGGIFLTNVFMPDSAINTFFRAIHTQETVETARPYTDFTLTPVVSELSSAKLTLSPTGILSFTEAGCVYPAADGKVSEVTQTAEGVYSVKLSHSEDFTGVISGLDQVYYAVGDEVKANVPVGYSKGETEVQVTMYSQGQLLNCFELTEENCLAWSAAAE